MNLLSRLLGRRPNPAAVATPAAALPPLLIVERVVTRVANLEVVEVPGDIRGGRAERKLHALLVDEATGLARQGPLVSRTPDGLFDGDLRCDRVTVPAFPMGCGPVYWLFVAEADEAPDAQALTPALLALARTLGDRPPLGALCYGTPPDASGGIRFSMLSDHPDPEGLPPLDQPAVDEGALTPEQRQWRREGVVLLKGFLDDDLLDPYIKRREQVDRALGWITPTPYMQVEELRRICLHPPLMAIMNGLIGEEMMLHLNLTGWASTERNWHQDEYLSPPFVNGWYAAVWIALDRIDPDSGPFEYVPGSHRWPLLQGEKVRQFLSAAERDRVTGTTGSASWPHLTERFVTPAIEAEIAAQGVETRRFLGEKGDVLIWHGRLMHRGSAPNRPGVERRSLIGHYTGINHRPDMPNRRFDHGGHYAVFDYPLK
ncbi:phytanoyl-CoA dioxygenase family protein [Nitrospirillum sp. BR 11163]|uniref:phytanoyl-CoA dioxygenase family protein n=1 Tax=Nitrospirillum sp. BR 11163 TaxID=3104323 RepID=UPI002AFE9AD8|nr:phytanoyl-CoA dioxygenase family protein [Nitrospirillum sp. BR 11163]MEA1674505.1 phytanoyl-CoA dioxygenase family protein [Nitrospirillum sp. BR 11163]